MTFSGNQYNLHFIDLTDIYEHCNYTSAKFQQVHNNSLLLIRSAAYLRLHFNFGSPQHRTMMFVVTNAQCHYFTASFFAPWLGPSLGAGHLQRPDMTAIRENLGIRHTEWSSAWDTPEEEFLARKVGIPRHYILFGTYVTSPITRVCFLNLYIDCMEEQKPEGSRGRERGEGNDSFK